MSVFNKIKQSGAELVSVQTIAVCSMMIALRIVLGMFTNFTLAIVPFVKIGFSFIPVVITAYLYGPVAAAIIHTAGDIFSVILSNPTAFSIIPGITVCCFIEGFIYGLILYKCDICYKRIIIAKAAVLIFPLLPLNTLFLSLVMNLPYLQLLLYRSAVLIPFAAVEVFTDFFMLKLTGKIFKRIRKI